jgi:hypothetical protein
LALASRAERAGDQETAQAARKVLADSVSGVATAAAGEAKDIDQTLRNLASRYEELRATMPPGPPRTAELDSVVREAKDLARQTHLNPEDVRMFQIGTEGRRVIALGLMEGDVDLADFDSVIDAIKNSLSAFEQYHGLVVASLMVPKLSGDNQRLLLEALQDPSVTSKMSDDSSRQALAARIVKRLRESQGGSN